MRRNEALKAKNRRAQARYRERQKGKFADYKSAVDELSQQLESLSAEKDALAADKAMLESCLQLSYQRGVSSGQEVADQTATPGSEAYQRAIWRSTGVGGPLLEAMSTVFNKARIACGQPPLTSEDIKNTSLDEVFSRKELCVQGTAALLNKLDEEGTQAAFQRLVDYMSEQSTMYHLLYTQYGQLARVMEASLVQTSRAKHGLPPPGFWAGVLEALCLTQEQREHLLQLRQQLLSRMEDVRQKRVSILQSLQGTLPSSDSRESVSSFANTFVEGTHSAELLRQSLHHEHQTTHEFTGTIRRKVLTPYQHAMLEVKSFPHKVDLLAICNALANETSPSAHDDRQAEARLLGLHESASGLVDLDEFAAELSHIQSDSFSDPQTSSLAQSRSLLHQSSSLSQPQSGSPHNHRSGSLSQFHSGSLGRESLGQEPLLGSSSNTVKGEVHPARVSLACTSPPTCVPISSSSEELQGGKFIGSPLVCSSLQMRNSEMDALLFEL